MKRAEELLEAAWAYAIYDGWVRYEPTPLYDQTAAEFGDVLAISRLAS